MCVCVIADAAVAVANAVVVTVAVAVANTVVVTIDAVRGAVSNYGSCKSFLVWISAVLF